MHGSRNVVIGKQEFLLLLKSIYFWVLSHRTVVLRLASLGVLVVTLYYSLHVEEQKVNKSCPEEVSGEQGKKCCGNNLWFGHNSTKEGSVKVSSGFYVKS